MPAAEVTSSNTIVGRALSSATLVVIHKHHSETKAIRRTLSLPQEFQVRTNI